MDEKDLEAKKSLFEKIYNQPDTKGELELVNRRVEDGRKSMFRLLYTTMRREHQHHSTREDTETHFCSTLEEVVLDRTYTASFNKRISMLLDEYSFIQKQTLSVLNTEAYKTFIGNIGRDFVKTSLSKLTEIDKQVSILIESLGLKLRELATISTNTTPPLAPTKIKSFNESFIQRRINIIKTYSLDKQILALQNLYTGSIFQLLSDFSEHIANNIDRIFSRENSIQNAREFITLKKEFGLIFADLDEAIENIPNESADSFPYIVEYIYNYIEDLLRLKTKLETLLL